ncbi:MAG: hypothetical protein C6I00_06535 [Nitratiruptor sp.]|nr:hypothetical protein [Nitratiruptor sp.]NPA83100.1 hypothetical protein [Campylobacterota bacterium]
MERLPLFRSWRERLAALVVVVLVAAGSLGWHYLQYRWLFDTSKRKIEVLVANQYLKDRRHILKLQWSPFAFATLSWEDLKDLRDRRIEVLLLGSKVPSFGEFLQGAFLPTAIIKVLPRDLRYHLKEAIAAQHHDPVAKELFGALFLATALSPQVRQRLSALGLAHLVAISGFHLGLIVALVSLLLLWLFKPLWQRFFPWINLRAFLFGVALLVALAYLLLVGALPSLVRAFVLLLIGGWLYWRHIKLVSFELLLWAILITLALMPTMLFRIGFWLSVAGVFFIYLFLHHFPKLSGWPQLIALNFWLYLSMFPIVHWFFPHFSWWQLLSPLLSIAFILFYPLAMLLHLFGLGGLFDPIVALIGREFPIYSITTPDWFFFLFLGTAVASIYEHRLIFLVLLLEVAFLIHNVAQL